MHGDIIHDMQSQIEALQAENKQLRRDYNFWFEYAVVMHGFIYEIMRILKRPESEAVDMFAAAKVEANRRIGEIPPEPPKP